MARTKRDLIKVTMNIERQDKDTLERFYPALGWSVAARKIINSACKRLLERENQDDEPTTID